MDEMTLTLNSPITEEQWDALTDVDFNNTDEIYFHTKHGKEVCFVKRKTGKWYKPTGMMPPEHFGRHRCSECDGFAMHDWKHHKEQLTYFCPNCGADMRGRENNEKTI